MKFVADGVPDASDGGDQSAFLVPAIWACDGMLAPSQRVPKEESEDGEFGNVPALTENELEDGECFVGQLRMEPTEKRPDEPGCIGAGEGPR